MGLLDKLSGKKGLTFPLPAEQIPQTPKNDAKPYGVHVKPASVRPGDVYWQVVLVHHLTPEENRKRHHIFVEVLDENGERAKDVEIIVKNGGTHVQKTETSPQKPALAFPMKGWTIYEVRVAGMPSDRVVNLTTALPAEGKGTPEGRHSFLIVWRRTRAAQKSEGVEKPAVTEPHIEEQQPTETSPQPDVETTPPVPPPPPTEPAREPEKPPTVQEETAQPTAPSKEEKPASPPPEPAEEKPAPAEITPQAEETPEEAEEVSPPPEPPEPEAVETPPTPVSAEPVPAAQRTEPPAPTPAEARAETPPPEPTTLEDFRLAEAETTVLQSEEIAPLPPEIPAAERRFPAFDTYVLFALEPETAARGYFYALVDDLVSIGVPFGFGAVDAATHYKHVIVVGHLSDAEQKHLEEANVQITTLAGDEATISQRLTEILSVG